MPCPSRYMSLALRSSFGCRARNNRSLRCTSTGLSARECGSFQIKFKFCRQDAPRSFFAWMEPASAASRNLKRDLTCSRIQHSLDRLVPAPKTSALSEAAHIFVLSQSEAWCQGSNALLNPKLLSPNPLITHRTFNQDTT